MQITIPVQEQSAALATDWLALAPEANAAGITRRSGEIETLIYVVLGSNFVAGMRVDRKTWVLLPSSQISVLKLQTLGAKWLPPLRQTNVTGLEYLQGLGRLDAKVWLAESADLPIAGSLGVQGEWLEIKSPVDSSRQLVAFQNAALITVMELGSVREEGQW